MRVRVTLQAVRNFPGDAVCRLRRLLKAMLRAYGLRAGPVEQVTAAPAKPEAACGQAAEINAEAK